MADFLVNWLASTPAFAVPYAIAALGLIVSEKAGVLALGAEGFMLVGAMAGVGAVVVMGGHPLLGLFVAALAAAAVALIFALSGDRHARRPGDRRARHRFPLPGADGADIRAAGLDEPHDRRPEQPSDLAAFGDSGPRPHLVPA